MLVTRYKDFYYRKCFCKTFSASRNKKSLCVLNLFSILFTQKRKKAKKNQEIYSPIIINALVKCIFTDIANFYKENSAKF